MTAGRRTPRPPRQACWRRRNSSASTASSPWSICRSRRRISAGKCCSPNGGTAAPNFDNPFIATAEDYKVRRIDPRKTRRTSGVIEIVRGLAAARGEDTAVMGFVYGPLGVLSQIRGHAELFKDLIRHPDRVLEAVQTISDVLVKYAIPLRN